MRGLLLLVLVGAGSAHAQTPVPGPALSPADVVRIQLEALRSGGAGDEGIATCFAFASPRNKRATGPLNRFARMIREGPYELMLRYQDVTFHPIEQHGASAVQRVTLIDATTVVTYLFVLSRQNGSPCQGCCPNCWMTDGVYIDTVGGRMT